MSEVQQFYEVIQKLKGGNVPWDSLDRQTQDMFMQAISVLVQIANLRV